MVHASTYPLNTGGPWGLARCLPLPPGQRDTGRGLPPLALSMPSALLPLPISIKNCSAAPPEAWTGAGVGFSLAAQGPVLRCCAPSAPGSGWRLGCHRAVRDRLTHPLNMLSVWHVRIRPRNVPGVQQVPTRACQTPRSHLLTCPCHVYRLGMPAPLLGSWLSVNSLGGHQFMLDAP